MSPLELFISSIGVGFGCQAFIWTAGLAIAMSSKLIRGAGTSR